MCRTGALLRVGKGHHIVRGVHFQTPFCFALTRAVSHCLCVCASAPPRSCETLFSVVVLVRSVLCLFCVVFYVLQVFLSSHYTSSSL